jgi:O-antigen/teichoic acid export membrane protein
MVFGALVQWAIVLTLVRIRGPIGLGEYTLSQAFVIPASYLAGLSLRQHLLVEHSEEYSLSDYFVVRLCGSVPFYAVTLALVFAAYRDTKFAILTAALCFVKYVDGISDLCAGVFQKRLAQDKIALYAMIRSAAAITVFVPFFYLTNRLTLALFAMAASSLCLCALLDYPASRRLWPAAIPFRLDAGTLVRAVRLVLVCFPLGIAAVIMSINASIPRLLLDHFGGPKELGYYSAVSHFIVIGGLFVTAFGQSLLPLLVKNVADNNPKSYWRNFALANAALIGAAMTAAGAAFFIGGPLLGLLYGPLFASKTDLLIVAALCSGFVFCGSLNAFAAMAARLYKLTAPVYLAAMAVNLAAGLYLIERVGAYGAFISQAIAGIVQIAIYCSVVAIYWRQRGILSPMGVIPPR